MTGSMHLLLALVATAIKLASASASLPYCQGEYTNTSATCSPFNLPGGGSQVDCNPHPSVGARMVIYNHPPKGFSSQEIYEKAVMVTNVFENGSPPTDYAICSNIGDGRGYTCGQGFTTDDGSALDPLLRYQKILGGKTDAFTKYKATLTKNEQGSGNACSPSRGSTAGLEGFAALWKKLSCTDPKFRQAQDDSIAATVDKFALAHAAYAGVTSDLGKLFFRDAMMQHGDGGGEPHIGMESIMTYAATLAPSPATANKIGDIATEAKYLAAFLESRRKLLCCYRPDGDLTWPKSADRTSDLGSLLADKETTLTLDGSLKLPAYGVTITTGTNTNDLAKTCKGISSSSKKSKKSTKSKKAHKKSKKSKGKLRR